MALTESKLKDLHDKKFDKLFEKHKAEWNAITTNAFKSAKDHICEGRTPRHDDVLLSPELTQTVKTLFAVR